MQLTVKDAANLLNVPEKTIYQWIEQKTIPVYQLNEQFRFNRERLLEWATSQRIPISPEMFLDAESTRLSRPSLTDALKAGGVIYHIEGKNKPSVLHALVDGLNLPKDVDREFLFQVLLARETLGSTGIGDGIAIPHVRNPVVLSISKPTVTLCFLEHPIDFGAIDGQPVDTLFTLISPTIPTHLHLLSQISYALRNQAFKAVVKKRAPQSEILIRLSEAESTLPLTNGHDHQTS